MTRAVAVSRCSGWCWRRESRQQKRVTDKAAAMSKGPCSIRPHAAKHTDAQPYVREGLEAVLLQASRTLRPLPHPCAGDAAARRSCTARRCRRKARCRFWRLRGRRRRIREIRGGSGDKEGQTGCRGRLFGEGSDTQNESSGTRRDMDAPRSHFNLRCDAERGVTSQQKAEHRATSRGGREAKEGHARRDTAGRHGRYAWRVQAFARPETAPAKRLAPWAAGKTRSGRAASERAQGSP